MDAESPTDAESPPDTEPQKVDHALLALECRVNALEEALAALREAHAAELRAAELRVAEQRAAEQRAGEQRAKAPMAQVPVAAMLEALTAQPLPPAVHSLVATTTSPSTLKQVARSSWLVLDMIQEATLTGRMLVDARYHTAWITRFLLIVIALTIFLSELWVPLSSIAFIGSIILKLVNFLLAGVLFVALFCETRRYKEWRQLQR